jgi:hypothetical protein
VDQVSEQYGVPAEVADRIVKELGAAGVYDPATAAAMARNGEWPAGPVAEQSPTTKKEESSARVPVPVVDPRAYAGLLGEIVAAAAPTTEADPVGIYATLLAGTGALIGSGPHVQVGNTRHPLLVWPLLLGRTGSGRKGETAETAELFLLLSSKEYSGLRETGLSSGEGLIEHIRDSDPDNPKDEGGTTDKRLVMIEPEFSTVMARAKREGSTLAGVLREAWSGKPLGVLNRRKLKASSSHIAIIGHVAPREFRLRLADADLAGGTFNRFLPLWVERARRIPIPEGIDPETCSGLAKRLGDAMVEANRISRIQLDRQATTLWVDELYDELTASDDEDQQWTEFTRRAAPYCLRIAALTAALDGRRLIGESDLAAAGALVRYAIASARYVLDDQLGDPRLDRLARAVGAAGPEGLSRSEISGLFSRNLPADQLDVLLGELLATGDYERFEAKTGGRTATRYRSAER